MLKAKYAMMTFNSKITYMYIISHCSPCSPKICRTWSFHIVVLQLMGKKCDKIQNACAEPLFCSLNLLFGYFLIGIAVVVAKILL